jgi:hypothetical protein
MRPAVRYANQEIVMKIVVIGGTGLIGSKTVERLRRKGHDVVAASPSSGVNTVTGEGLAAALAGAQVVVDLANSPSFEEKAALAFFEAAGRNLLSAEASAGVRHHVALSVVGTDRMQAMGYFRAKLLQETLIRRSGIPTPSSTRRSSSSSSAPSPSPAPSGAPSGCPRRPSSRLRPVMSPPPWPTWRWRSRRTA